MLEKIPVKKEYLLITATIVLLLLGYRFAFQHTVEAWQINKQLKVKITQTADLDYQPGYLERKNDNLDKVIYLYKADTAEFRSNIINTIASIAEKEHVKLTEVPLQDVSYRADHFIIERLAFEGDYFALVRLANDLQSTKKIGTLRAEIWKLIVVKSNNDAVKRLVLEVYLEIGR